MILKKDFGILLTAFLIFLVWFTNFPTLRYAGYIIVFFLIIFPFCIFFRDKVDLKQKKNLKKLSIIFAISYLIFLSKNVSRINKELEVSYENHHNFKNFPFFWVKDNKYETINLNGHMLYKVGWFMLEYSIDMCKKYKPFKNNKKKLYNLC